MFHNKEKLKRVISIIGTIVGTLFFTMSIIARKKKGDTVYVDEPEEKNPLEGKKVIFIPDESKEENADGKKGYLKANGYSSKHLNLYDRYVKRGIDIVLSFGGLIVLSPLYFMIAVAIKIDDPGPVLFTQKRIGKNKQYFKLHKFRSMKMSTPHDVPTHMLDNPEQYITRVGKFLRRHSLDELPQIWDIFVGNMSVIGPRPALWNQDVLIAERDKYGVNDVKPGLTGWAQINGRDELEIPAKAKLDGEYVKRESLLFDIKCFIKTISKIAKDDSVVEGGTGEINKKRNGIKKSITPNSKKIYTGVAIASVLGMIGSSIVLGNKHRWKKKLSDNSIGKRNLGFRMMVIAVVTESIATVYSNLKRRVKMADDFVKDKIEVLSDEKKERKTTIIQKKILITGADSYIGTSVEKWLLKYPDQYKIDTLDLQDNHWKEKSFAEYDVIYHVAGIAHADIGSVSEEQKEMYYKVNTELAIETAKKAKVEGVKQFIFMSSMIIYSGCKEKIIHADTEPKPLNFYGDSKLQADRKIQELSSENFRVVILRPPMIYGKGSKGNYPELAKLAAKLPVFPIVKNKRSMLHIDNLCEFVKLMIDNEESGVFFPQNREYTNTSDMVQMIADVKGHRIVMIPGTGTAVRLLGLMPGKVGSLAAKAFGDSAYDMQMSEYKENYRVNSLRKSIELTEGTGE